MVKRWNRNTTETIWLMRMENQVNYYRKRYRELLKMLSDEKKPDSYEHVLDQLEGVERELYRLGQQKRMKRTAKKYKNFEQ